jgi:hypothetical protein
MRLNAELLLKVSRPGMGIDAFDAYEVALDARVAKSPFSPVVIRRFGLQGHFEAPRVSRLYNPRQLFT